MGQRPRALSEDERRAERQAASDRLADALGWPRFTLPDHVDVPPMFSPQTALTWPEWSAAASGAVKAAERTRVYERPRSRTVLDDRTLEWLGFGR